MIHRRREFPNPVKREAYERSGGICECHRVWQLPTYKIGCGCQLGEGNTFYEHIEPDAMLGNNDLENCAVLVKTCWRLKTDSYDRPTIDKADRQRDRHQAIRPYPSQVLVGTKRSGIKKPLRPFARPIDRETGKPP